MTLQFNPELADLDEEDMQTILDAHNEVEGTMCPSLSNTVAVYDDDDNLLAVVLRNSAYIVGTYKPDGSALDPEGDADLIEWLENDDDPTEF